MIIISGRDSIEVTHGNWKMLYHPTGAYSIYKNDREYAHGRYDAVIADSYNHEMPGQDRKDNLTRDLISWIGKPQKGNVTN
jgi:hypothetical protein